MENFTVVLNNAEEYDKAVHSGHPERGDLKIISKADCTGRGNPGVCITFTAVIDGREVQVQAATTAQLLVTAARAILNAHPEMGDV